ncbi:MAG: hypothetical protein HZB67_05855 [Candidatus Aenigmarchaeota archaeon]|nr:hypothetical protein [Candidatus Aenigmarchaeota archaeon]
MMYAAIRIRGGVNDSEKARNRMKSLGLMKKNSAVILDETYKDVIRKLESFVAWGEINDEMLKKLKSRSDGNVFYLHPPKGGFKSVRHFHPEGNLGYCGKDINNLLERML